jgi:maltose O-acetyltransferase
MTTRSNKEKMLAGESYNCLDAELEAQRQQVKKALRRYNQTDDPLEQQTILQSILGKLGPHTLIWPPFYCVYGQNIYLGEYVFLNVLCTILDAGEVRLGNHVMVGPGVQMYTSAHALQAEARNEGWEIAKPITVEDNVWIGGSAILMPGVRVGRNSVVGAGAVVTRDVPANVVVAGNPARVIREIEQ